MSIAHYFFIFALPGEDAQCVECVRFTYPGRHGAGTLGQEPSDIASYSILLGGGVHMLVLEVSPPIKEFVHSKCHKIHKQCTAYHCNYNSGGRVIFHPV